MKVKCPKCRSDDVVITRYKWYVHRFNSVSGTIRPCQASLVRCSSCNYEWLTSAKYVEDLKEAGKVAPHEARNIERQEINRRKLLAGEEL